MRWFSKLRSSSRRVDPKQEDMGEPLLTCFDCGRPCTLEHLTLYPWWDSHTEAFDAMYRCTRCLPKVHKALERTLRNNPPLAANVAAFLRQRVNDGFTMTACPDSTDESLAVALEALDALRTHKAFIVRRKP
jgi:hypothetical protein